MIPNILDNDSYKLTMQQAVHMPYPRAEVRYTFINRTGIPKEIELCKRTLSL